MSTRAWIAFALQSVLWGVPYLFIKIAVDGDISPVFIAWARTALAAVILIPLAWRSGSLRSLRGRYRWLVVFAVFEVVIPFPLIAAGERHIDSSLAAILIASAPLMVAALAIRFDHTERVEGLRLVGLLVGFVGVIALVGLDVGGHGSELLGAAAILVAAFGYAVGPMVLKRKGLTDLDPKATMGASLAIAAAVLTPFAAVSAPSSAPPTDAIVAVIVLGIFCTALAFVIWSVLVGEIGAGRALVVTYVNPVVALTVGAIVLDEHPGAGAIVGLLLILAGSWLSTDGRLPPGLMRRIRPNSGRAPARRERRLGMMGRRLARPAPSATTDAIPLRHPAGKPESGRLPTA